MSDSAPLFSAASREHCDADAVAQPGALATQLGALITAIQFLTRVPISSAAPSAAALRSAPLFFPLVGMLIGGFTAALVGLSMLWWPIWLAVVLALAAEAMLTGALHEDGLADFCDALGGGRTREGALEILKDSRIGTYGTLALGFGVTLRAGCLISIIADYGPQQWVYWAAAVIASAAVSRWVIVLAMVLVPPVPQRESLSRDVGSTVSWTGFALSGVGAAAPLAWFAYLMPASGLLALVLVALAVAALLSLIRRRLGGITGDCLGCIGYVAQVLVLLAAAARVA